ncbi:MAG: M61 family metallopeptidase [Candidatus Velthaea sp.]
MRARFAAAAAILAFGAIAVPACAAEPLMLVVDAREVARNIVHMRLDVPVAAGSVSLVYPKWVPGNHAPSNPVVDLVMLQADAGGKRVEWRRDPLELYAFTFDVPAGATTLSLRYDALLSPGYTTANLALINWTPALLYPSGSNVTTTTVKPAMLLPGGWTAASALDGMRSEGTRLAFAPVSLERLVDSPVLAGSNLRAFALTPTAELDVASDSPAAAEVNAGVRAHFSALVAEAQSLFGSHHWRSPYRFLITAADAIGYTGLEHHESSWNGVDTSTLETEAATKKFAGDLLTHEFTHSWNGKFRRPAGLYRTDFQADETTELLWVYEGLTEYYSDILAARAGFWTAAEYREAIAAKYATLDAQSGRASRSIVDSTFQARLGRTHSGFAGARYATQEYYDESELMWLDADTLIRERTKGAKSLDDFARAFFGGSETLPSVVPYTRADVIAALNSVLPSDWAAFFSARIDIPTAHPPLQGITRGGYALKFVAKPATPNPSARNGATPTDFTFSLGSSIGPTGVVRDVVAGTPAARAGLVPNMTVIAVDGRRYTPAGVTAAMERAAKTHTPIVFIVEDRQSFATLSLAYDGGQKLPELQRASGRDLIAEILKPRVAAK